MASGAMLRDDWVARRLYAPLAAVLLAILVGTLGYVAIEGWPLLDALYMTVITLGSVGFREVEPLDPKGVLFTIALVLVGVASAAYIGATVVQYVVEGRIGGVLNRRKVRRMIDKLHNHVVICGYGRVGQAVAQELLRQGAACLVVDSRQERVDAAQRDGFLALCGDASQDEVLLAAGIARARSLVTAVDSDADNIYITLSARVLAPNLHIIARAGDNSAEAKLLRVGANRVLSPYSLAGRHLALLAVRSAVVDFVSGALSGSGGTGQADPGHELRLENVIVSEGGQLRGSTPDQVRVRLGEGPTLLAVTTRAGQLLTDFTAVQSPLQPGDLLILIGTASQLKQVEQLA
jgi:voltage-gated potassium channel